MQIKGLSLLFGRATITFDNREVVVDCGRPGRSLLVKLFNALNSSCSSPEELKEQIINCTDEQPPTVLPPLLNGLEQLSS